VRSGGEGESRAKLYETRVDRRAISTYISEPRRDVIRTSIFPRKYELASSLREMVRVDHCQKGYLSTLRTRSSHLRPDKEATGEMIFEKFDSCVYM
jgi:hypothetical protein